MTYTSLYESNLPIFVLFLFCIFFCPDIVLRLNSGEREGYLGEWALAHSQTEAVRQIEVEQL